MRDVECRPHMADASCPDHMLRLRLGVGGRGTDRGTERVCAQEPPVSTSPRKVHEILSFSALPTALH